MNDITELGNAVKTRKNESVIYGICPGRDLFNQKSYEVNQLLVGKYGENGFNYILIIIIVQDCIIIEMVSTYKGKVSIKVAAIVNIILTMPKV